MVYRIINFTKFYILLTSLAPEWSCTDISGPGATHRKSYSRNVVRLCPDHESILFEGVCELCIERPNVDMNDLAKLNLTPLKYKNPLTQVEVDYSDPLLSEGSGNDCPFMGENIQKRRVGIGSRKLNGLTLNVVTIQRQPFSTVDMNHKFTGVVFEFLYALQEKYNFSINPFLPYDGNWGSPDKTGFWNGMIGQVIRKEADVGAAAFSVTIERAHVVDFTVPYHQEPTGILIPAPTEGERLSVVVRPLSNQVWLALFVTIFILIPSFYVLHICSVAITKDITANRKSFLSIIGESLMFITGSLVQESVISPFNKTTRFLIAIWWMVTLILANIYMAFLVSFLSVPKLHNSVDSLEQLAEQSEIKWTFRSGTAHHTLFKSNSSSGLFKTIGDHVPEDQIVLTDHQGVEKVLTSKTAFIKEKSYLDVALGDDFKSHKKCRLTLAKESFFTIGLAFVVQKRSPYLNLLDFEISNALATGLLDKWKTNHWPSDLWCVDAASFIISTQPPTRKLTINDLQGTFLVLGTGIITAVFGFIIEQICFRRKSFRLASSISTEPMIVMMR